MNPNLKAPLLLFCVLTSLPGLLLAGDAKIHCFVDKKGVTNCTNVHAATPAKPKPQSIARVPSSLPKPMDATPQTIAAPPAVKAVATLAPSSGQARTTYVYRYKQSNGAALLTNVPQRALTLISTSAYQTFDKGWTGSLFKSANWKLNREAYNEAILAMANEKAVDPALVRAVIHAESSFNPTAVSRTGAMGLMQLMPGTAARFGVGNAFDPQENIRGGVTYLRFLLDKFNGDVRLAAAGYNAGEGAVMKYGGVPPYNETTEYVARVLDLHGKYRAEN
ncbi:MAG: hypothetical protein B7Y40_09675 [Gammaproteobacteria bacterium 28-57-27]|nr:MAG: hypothetical protein B7Y40_09675 [Gammaproteobacteria bacterium 28-57-27]